MITSGTLSIFLPDAVAKKSCPPPEPSKSFENSFIKSFAFQFLSSIRSLEIPRLKITLSDLLKMEVWEYNHWLSYFMIETEEHNEAVNKSRYK